jgi:hypothetical protein
MSSTETQVYTDPDTAVYMVFARLLPTEPLGHLGTVRATNVELARSYAHTTYDEDKWIEMMVVPRSAVSWVKTTDDL